MAKVGDKTREMLKRAGNRSLTSQSRTGTQHPFLSTNKEPRIVPGAATNAISLLIRSWRHHNEGKRRLLTTWARTFYIDMNTISSLDPPGRMR